LDCADADSVAPKAIAHRAAWTSVLLNFTDESSRVRCGSWRSALYLDGSRGNTQRATLPTP
jgi:hypothetical protein